MSQSYAADKKMLLIHHPFIHHPRRYHPPFVAIIVGIARLIKRLYVAPRILCSLLHHRPVELFYIGFILSVGGVVKRTDTCILEAYASACGGCRIRHRMVFALSSGNGQPMQWSSPTHNEQIQDG